MVYGPQRPDQDESGNRLQQTPPHHPPNPRERPYSLRCLAWSLYRLDPQLGGYDGVLWDHNTGDDDNGTAIDSIFETAHPSPEGADVKVRWLNARHFYDGKGEYSIAVTQRGTSLSGTTKNISLVGAGFTLDVDRLDFGVLSDVVQLSQDSKLQDYAPNSGLKVSMNTADQSFKYYKAQLRYKPIGRVRKPPPRG